MFRYILVFALFLLSFTANAQNDNKKPLMDLIEKISSAKNLYVEYQTNTVKGKFSIGEEAIYMSQENKVEIFEYKGSRFIYNPKRERVDIESIRDIDDNIKNFLNWSNNIGQYAVTTKERGGDRKTSYTLTKGSEVVEVDLSSAGELLKFSYENKEVKKISFNIRLLSINKKSTLDFFTFDPQKREDILVTDYR